MNAWRDLLYQAALEETGDPAMASEIADEIASSPAHAEPAATRNAAPSVPAPAAPVFRASIKPPELRRARELASPEAQRIFARAAKAVQGLSAEGLKELKAIFAAGAPAEQSRRLQQFITRYRLVLARTLTDAQTAALVAGMREIVQKLPGEDLPAPPPTLPPDQAERMVELLKEMPPERQPEFLARLPADQREYVERAAAISRIPPAPPWPLRTSVPGDPPPIVEFPVIQEAAQSLRDRRVLNAADFEQLAGDARSQAFTVAAVESEATLRKIQELLARNIEAGVSFGEFAERAADELSEGTFLSPAHMETVFRTNVSAAFTDGMNRVLDHPVVQSGFPYAAYEAIDDDRVRHDHLAMMRHGINGTNVYRIDDPVFRLFMPPWDYSCRCSWTPLSVEQAADRGIPEAIEWLRTGQAPERPAWVPMPEFQPPPGFRRTVMLSLAVPERPKVALPARAAPAASTYIPLADQHNDPPPQDDTGEPQHQKAKSTNKAKAKGRGGRKKGTKIKVVAPAGMTVQSSAKVMERWGKHLVADYASGMKAEPLGN